MQFETDTNTIVIFALFLLAAGLAGGMTPIYVKLKESGLHIILAFGTGMLLGTIFLDMLPNALSEKGSPLLVLVGLIVMFVLERLVFQTQNNLNASHTVIGMTAFFGLSLHAVLIGLGLSAQLAHPLHRTGLMTSLIIHKFSETFALSTVFLLASYSKNKTITILMLFASFTPLAMLAGNALIENLHREFVSYASGLAAGSFLYVAVLDLLPEVFHDPKGKWVTLSSLLAGIFVMLLIMNYSGLGHSH